MKPTFKRAPRVLGTKHHVTDEQWNDVARNIENHVTRTELDNLADYTIEKIKKTAHGKRVAYGWSGGKDSIALAWLMEQAGIHESLLATLRDLEFPAFVTWAQENAPDGCTIINTGHSWEWLRNHPDMLFPTGKHATRWAVIGHQPQQTKYFHEHNLDIFALGRRTIDGNHVGPNKGNPYTRKDGQTNWAPIADWTHEEVLALFHYHKLQLPPLYDYPRAIDNGTLAWPARKPISQRTADHQAEWNEIYTIDPHIVARAAHENIPGAGKYLRTR